MLNEVILIIFLSAYVFGWFEDVFLIVSLYKFWMKFMIVLLLRLMLVWNKWLSLLGWSCLSIVWLGGFKLFKLSKLNFCLISIVFDESFRMLMLFDCGVSGDFSVWFDDIECWKSLGWVCFCVLLFLLYLDFENNELSLKLFVSVYRCSYLFI